MADKITKKQRSKTMSAIRSTGTKFERSFLKLLSAKLYKKGIRYRINHSSLPGKPDIAFMSKRVVVFLDGCFWHGCKKHFRMPKSNLRYWRPKISRNIARSHEVNVIYRKTGWKILRFWEHQIRSNPQSIILRIAKTWK